MAGGHQELQFSGEKRVFFTYNMPFGKVTIASDGKAVTNVVLGQAKLDGSFSPDALTNLCANQLVEYLSGKRSVFDVPLAPKGTEFQKRVWDAVCAIPYSHVVTSKQLAESMGAPETYRMVGAAVRRNPIIMLIPAHRVMPSSGHVDKNDEHAMLRQAFRELEKKYG